MALILRVDGERWRAHLRDILERHPGLVPVTKGNGYGFGNGRLARKAQWLGVDTMAVGTYEEIPHVEQRYDPVALGWQLPPPFPRTIPKSYSHDASGPLRSEHYHPTDGAPCPTSS